MTSCLEKLSGDDVSGNALMQFHYSLGLINSLVLLMFTVAFVDLLLIDSIISILNRSN